MQIGALYLGEYQTSSIKCISFFCYSLRVQFLSYKHFTKSTLLTAICACDLYLYTDEESIHFLLRPDPLFPNESDMDGVQNEVQLQTKPQFYDPPSYMCDVGTR